MCGGVRVCRLQHSNMNAMYCISKPPLYPMEFADAPSPVDAGEPSSPSDEEDEEEPTCCSYALTGDKLMMQGVYRCLTCTTEAEANKCCCVGCAESCHWEHDVEYIGYGLSYCDCGAGACELFGSSREVAQQVLRAAGGNQVCHEATGRIAGSSTSGLQVQEFSEFLWGSLADVDVCRTLEEQAAALVRFSKETFWLGAGEAPRCVLEAVAAQVFRLHTRGVALDPARSSGAEWWVQVKPCSPVGEGGDLEADAASAIDLHYDKDEFLAERFAVGVYPQISTVTYVTCGNVSADRDYGGTDVYSNTAPTVVVDNVTGHPVGRAMNRAYISRPAVGKHISFDGLYLHGVPSHRALRRVRPTDGFSLTADSVNSGNEEMRTVEELREHQPLRITVLVNIWLGHRPAAVDPLPEDILRMLPEVLTGVASRLYPDRGAEADGYDDVDGIIPVRDIPHIKVFRSPPVPEATTADENQTAAADAIVVVGTSNGEWLKLPFVSSDATWGKEDDEDADLVLKMWLPGIAMALGREEDTVCIEYVNNAAARSGPAGSKKKKRGAREDKAEPLLCLGYD